MLRKPAVLKQLCRSRFLDRALISQGSLEFQPGPKVLNLTRLLAMTSFERKNACVGEQNLCTAKDLLESRIIKSSRGARSES